MTKAVAAPSPTAARSSIKTAVILALTLQASACSLLLRYTRLHTQYYTIVAVLTGEVLKLVLCGAIILASGSRGVSTLIAACQPRVLLPMALPGLLFTAQNMFVYYASGKLPAPVSAVLQQSKILTTALFSVGLLRTQLTWRKWQALGLLVLGVVITQSAESREGGSAPSPAGPGLFGSGVQLNVVLGVAALLASATLSGYSTVYLETMLKAADPDSDVNPIWTRNVQLSLCSVVFCVLNLASDGREWEAVMQGRAFDGFLPVVWVAVANMSIGGILVAASLRYVDALGKTVATAVSLILSSVASTVIFEFQPSLSFMFGVALVICAVWMYSAPVATKPHVASPAGVKQQG